MNQEISEAITHSITPGDCADLYYPGMENTKKSCYATYVENRYYQALPAQAFGSSSTLLFNPDAGLSDIVLTLALPAPAQVPGAYAGLALQTGWGYSMIESLGIRIAGSSYYTFTGDELLVGVLSDAEDSIKRNALMVLGGQAMSAARPDPAGGAAINDFTDVNKRTAYVYLKCPWNTVSAQEKCLPLPTDLLTQPVQFVIKLKAASQIFFQNPAAVVAPAVIQLPAALASADANFRQVHMMDQGNLLARREDMNVKALSYPLRYFQNTTFSTSQAVTGGTPVQLNLTGFRSGSLKSIDMWIVRTSDAQGGNPWNWVQPQDVNLKINGLVYYDSRASSSQMWSLCDRKTTASVDIVNVSASGAQQVFSDAVAVPWTNIPFAQHVEQLADGESENVVALGVPLMNSVVNLSVTLPADGTYQFNFAYNYVSALLFSRGSCEYIF